MRTVVNPEAPPTRIAVIASGSGSEQSVSLSSAQSVSAALLETFAWVKTFPFNVDLRDALLSWGPDVAFPVAHGDGETGELQHLLDAVDLPYVGSDAASSARCWDKTDANRLAADVLACLSVEITNHVPGATVPPFVALHRGDDIRGVIERFCDQFVPAGAIVVKPAKEGSSVGVKFCTVPGHKFLTANEVVSTVNGPIKGLRLDKIVQCVEATFALDEQVIVQRKVVGTEITVGVLEFPDPEALPVVEIVTPSGAWYDYDHKYAVGGSEHIIPARVPVPWLELAQMAAVQLHQRLGCRDYSRIDFILERPGPDTAPTSLCFLEVNTLPGFTPTSLFPDAARAAGHALPSLVKKLVLQAWERRRAGGIADRCM